VAAAASETERAPGERGGPGLAIVAAKVLTCAQAGPQVVDNAVLILKDGVIERVAARGKADLPGDYEVLDVGERWLAPGLVDLHCHVGGPNILRLHNDINDLVFLAQPELRVAPAVIPDNRDLREAVAGGVTTVLFIPGSGVNVGGQGILLKTGFARFEEMRVRDPGSLKIAQAGNPERWAIGVGRSLMNWNTRDTLRRGVAYAQRWREHGQGRGERPRVDPQFEVFRPLLAKTTQISVHTQMYQVVLMTLTMLRGEFGFDCYIDHGEWWGSRAAPLAERLGVQAIIGPREIDSTIPGFIDTDGQIRGIAAEYQRQGHSMIGFNTDSPIVPESELSLQAAVACRYGFENGEMQALRGLTIVPATTAGIDARVGSLEPGKDADVLVVDGDPADPRTAVDVVFIEGRRVYDASREPRRW
jgi:imidazolonepropionase-like amidohydrolase